MRERARADALDQRLMEMLVNSQKSEENAERARVLTGQLEAQTTELAAAQAAAAAEARRARGLRQELQALAEASQQHLGEYAALSDALHEVSRVCSGLLVQPRMFRAIPDSVSWGYCLSFFRAPLFISWASACTANIDAMHGCNNVQECVA